MLAGRKCHWHFTDAADAEAICEAVTRPNMRFALNAGLWFRRDRRAMVFPSLAASCCCCAENPLIPAVQFFRATSEIVRDKLDLYSAALGELGLAHLHVTVCRLNNRAEVSHKPTSGRERRMGRFKSPGSMQRFLSFHDAIYNHFNLRRHLISRPILRQMRARAAAEWIQIVAA